MRAGQGATRSVKTNSFGNYRFDEIQAAEKYTFQVLAKGCVLEAQTVTISEDLTNLNFTPAGNQLKTGRFSGKPEN